MPTDDRLDKENVIHVDHGILCNHQKKCNHVLCRDLDGVGSHYPQKTNAGTENQIPCSLTYKWELNDESTWTQDGQGRRGTTHTGACGEWWVGGGRASGGIANGGWASTEVMG